MAISFTPAQEKVIQLHNRNILVSAAAGSGKTAVLVERIVRMVCDEANPVDIDRLLVVTFTNAAAAEMRERISKGISERLQEHPESEHIQRQATLLHHAQITTIHSFCLFLIRNHFHEIGLDPAFRVADEGEIKLLRQDVLAELLEEKFAEGTEEFFHCVEYFCFGGQERVLEDYILKLSEKASSSPFPEEWLEFRKTDYTGMTLPELSETVYGKYLATYLSRLAEGCAEKLRAMLELCRSQGGPSVYAERLEEESRHLEELGRLRTLEEYRLAIPEISFGRLPAAKGESVSESKKKQVQEVRNRVKKTVSEKMAEFFETPAELALAQMAECRGPLTTLLDLVVEFDRRMKQKKQEQRIVDFSDMEHYALDILLCREGGEVRPSAVAQEYRSHFHEILIDEYQDSNLVQEYILKAVSGEDEGNFNRFMVGDVKQSIYKFRMARPEIFLEKYDTYQSGEGDCRRMDLAQNFRSRTQVVDSVNHIFSRIMRKEIGGVDYDGRAALYAGAVYPENAGCESEMLLIERSGREAGNEAVENKNMETEAKAIAERIQSLRREFRVTDKGSGELRPVCYSDIVILLRTPSGWAEEFKKVLEGEGIPVYITSKTGYFAATEVQDVLQVLRVLNNPTQDIPLFGMMRSVFGGFTEEEIARIRSEHKSGSLYRALCAYSREQSPLEEEERLSRVWKDTGDAEASGQAESAEGSENHLRQRVSAFLELVKRYRAYTTYLPVRELLQRLADEFDYLNYVTALPAGSKRRANVEMLFGKASDFEKTTYVGLFHFVRYMEQLEKYAVDYGEADVLDENADVVRIMSIHQSKGLEFPITFVAGLAKQFNMKDARQAFLIDTDFGIGMDYIHTKRRIRNKTLRKMALAKKIQEENLAEELRLLYVAMTRAKEKLILAATVPAAEECWEMYREYGEEKLSYLDYVQASSCMDFLFPILAKTDLKVKVILPDELEANALEEQMRLGQRRLLLEQAEQMADAESLDRLRKRFSYDYSHKELEKLYTKTTVSELKIAAMAEKDEAAYHAFEEREVVPYIPAFRRGEEKVSATVRGNAFHRAMERMDFVGILGKQFAYVPTNYGSYLSGLDVKKLEADLREFLQREVREHRLAQEYYDALNQGKLVRFLQSEWGWRMWSAQTRGELYREQPFVIGVDAGRLGEGYPTGEKVLVQGIIDVFFVENGEMVLLDYKTDVIASMEELWTRYQVQMEYYEEALCHLMEMPVKEKVLYSFYLEQGKE